MKQSIYTLLLLGAISEAQSVKLGFTPTAKQQEFIQHIHLVSDKEWTYPFGGEAYNDIRSQELKCLGDRNAEWHYDAAANVGTCKQKSLTPLVDHVVEDDIRAQGKFKATHLDVSEMRSPLDALALQKPMESSLLQTESQGIPVYVNPESVLYPNTEAATSLAFSGFQVGLDELNLVQTKTEGFPVYVNPESVLYPNTQAATNFGFVDMPVGLDELNLVQTKSEGTPIYVNPESVLYSNTQAATNFGFTDIPVGLDEVSFLMTQHREFQQEQSLLQTEGTPIYVNPESVLYSNTQAATNFGFTDIPVGLDEVSFLMTQHRQFQEEQSLLQTEGTPIYVNPESVLYSNTQAATNFGFTDIPVGLDEVSFLMTQHRQFQEEQTLLQTESEGVPIYVNPESVLYPNTQAATNFGFVDMPVGLDELNLVQTQNEAKLMPIAAGNKPGNLAIVERDVDFNPTEFVQLDAEIMPIDKAHNKPGNLAIVERDVNFNVLDM